MEPTDVFSFFGFMAFVLYLTVGAAVMLVLGFGSAMFCKWPRITAAMLAVVGAALFFAAGPQSNALDLNCLVASAGLVFVFGAFISFGLTISLRFKA